MSLLMSKVYRTDRHRPVNCTGTGTVKLLFFCRLHDLSVYNIMYQTCVQITISKYLTGLKTNVDVMKIRLLRAGAKKKISKKGVCFVFQICNVQITDIKISQMS